MNWNTNNRKVYIDRYNVDNANSNVRARAEVSALLPPSGGIGVYILQPSGGHLRGLDEADGYGDVLSLVDGADFPRNAYKLFRKFYLKCQLRKCLRLFSSRRECGGK